MTFVIVLFLLQVAWNYIKEFSKYGKGSLNMKMPMKIILVDPNLVRTFFANILFDPNYGAHLWKELFFDVH